MLAARKVGAPREVDRGPAREPARGRAVAPRARHRAGWRSTPTARSWPPHIDFVPDCGAYPTPWPVGHGRRGRHAVPRARTACPTAGFADQVDLHEHRRAHRVPRPVAVRDRSPARCCSTSRPRQMGIDPVELRRRNLLRARRAAVRERQRHALRQHLAAPRRSSRRSRCSTTTRSARSRPTARDAGRYLGVGHRATTSSRPTPGHRLLRHRRRDDPHRAVGHGQRVRRRWLDRQQPRDHRRAAHRRRARRRHRRRQHDPGRHRAHAASARAPAAAAAAR